MEALAGYASSSSSSCEERPSQPGGRARADADGPPRPTSLTTLRRRRSKQQQHNGESLQPSSPRDAHHGGPADDPRGPGGGGDGAPDEAGDDGRRKRFRRRPPGDEPKGRVVVGDGVGREVSVDYGGGASFRRSHPHWEGRWTGHIYLPFPAEEKLGGLANEEDSSTGRQLVPQDGNSDSSSEEGSSESEDDCCVQSMQFIPTARKLVDLWASMLRERRCDGSVSNEGLVIVPHFGTRGGPSLHVSLARPVFLPSSSVDSFMEDVHRSLGSVLTRQQGPRPKARILQLQPRDAVVLTNDDGTRSFLAVPVSGQSSRWVKQTLLPSVDAAMLKYGQQTYYTTPNDGGGCGDATPATDYGTGCILHVSVASVCGDVATNKTPLFPGEGGGATAEDRSTLPAAIPVRVERVTVDFGGGKKLALDL